MCSVVFTHFDRRVDDKSISARDMNESYALLNEINDAETDRWCQVQLLDEESRCSDKVHLECVQCDNDTSESEIKSSQTFTQNFLMFVL